MISTVITSYSIHYTKLYDHDENSNIIATFDDDGATLDCSTIGDGLTVKSPISSFSEWKGENALGNWILKLGDYGAIDVGTLNSCVITSYSIHYTKLYEYRI